jgi:1-pyrroline-5-carboxylate dehydrogenase
MGGKDFILVDETADLDSAAAGVVSAAFGFQGQKCSACSRLIVVDSVHDALVARVVEGTKALKLGPAWEPETRVGPVINAGAQKKILEYVEIGKSEGKLLTGGGPGPDTGFFVQPTVIDDVSPDARIAREEIFGPVLAVIRAKDFDEGVALANDSEYGLTGALYSRDPGRIERGNASSSAAICTSTESAPARSSAHPVQRIQHVGNGLESRRARVRLPLHQAKAIAEKFSLGAPLLSAEGNPSEGRAKRGAREDLRRGARAIPSEGRASAPARRDLPSRRRAIPSEGRAKRGAREGSPSQRPCDPERGARARRGKGSPSRPCD